MQGNMPFGTIHLRTGQGKGKSAIQQGDPRLGWWLLPRCQLMYFHCGRRRIGQDGGMFTKVLYPGASLHCCRSEQVPGSTSLHGCRTKHLGQGVFCGGGGGARSPLLCQHVSCPTAGLPTGVLP